tara:strand:- start:10005 stop:10724 length:720 start_codon:yes stop_codon:yes gene_type:complete
MSFTANARGTYSDIKVVMNDVGLRRALRMLGKTGEDNLDGFLKLITQEQVAIMQKELKSKAGALANVRVPSPKGLPFAKSKNIYVKVADALKIHKMKKMEYKVHTGESIQQAERGVLGQRGGKIAHIVAKGMNPFRYGNLPPLVMSSTRWYKKTGVAGWITTGMKMKRTHPGFKDTLDFIGLIEKRVAKEFESKVDSAIVAAGIAAGFSTTESLGMGRSAVGGKVATSTGGTGIMSARK